MIIPFMDKSLSQSPLRKAIIGLLRPIVRLLIKNEISHSEFSEFAKEAYVRVAYDDFAIPNRKKTFSRAAVLTGLSRKEVVRLTKNEAPTSIATPKIWVNRAARVVTGWLNDPDFHNKEGKPSPLPLREEFSDDNTATFANLVERYSGDITARAILDELTRLKIVSVIDKKKVQLEKQGFIPDTDDAASIDILFNCAGNLLNTGASNIIGDSGEEKKYQRQLTHFDIPQSIATEFKQYSQKRSQALLLELDHWLANKTKSTTPKTDQQISQIGVGIYYFEDDNHED